MYITKCFSYYFETKDIQNLGLVRYNIREQFYRKNITYINNLILLYKRLYYIL